MTHARTIVAAAVAVTSAVSHGQVPRPVPTGPYAIGRQNIVWTDSTRRDPADTTQLRRINAWVWYPATPEKAATAEPPLPRDWNALRLEKLQRKLGPHVASAMREFTVAAHTNAPLIGGRARLPVLLFLPGLSWLATDYSVLLEELASHGYVVVGLSPTGFSEPVAFPDGRVVGQSLGVGASIGTDQAHIQDDAAFALRAIRDFDHAGIFRGRIDLARLGVFGHSIGGATSLLIAAGDTTIRGAIDIDGDAMGNVLTARPRQPLLLISSDLPHVDEASLRPGQRIELVRQGLERSEQRRTDDWTSISSESTGANRIRIPGAQHLNFTDAALAADGATAEQRWMKFGPVEPARALTMTAELVRAFFDQTFERAKL